MNQLYSNKIPHLLKESTVECDHINKIFASTWVDDDNVVLGTKDNELMKLNYHTHKLTKIPVATRKTIPVFNCKGQFINEKTILPNETAKQKPATGCGIHSLEMNSSRTILATTAESPCDVAIYSNIPSVDPVYILSGHTDWIFSMRWINDNILVTGGVNSSLGFWNITGDDYSAAPIGSIVDTPDTVRDMDYNPLTQTLYVLNSHGKFYTYDLCNNSVPISTYSLADARETVTVKHNHDYRVLAIGSKMSTILLDTRISNTNNQIAVVNRLDNHQHTWGTRSLIWNGAMLSSTGGNGKVTFYDIRANKYLEFGTEKHIELSRGYVKEDTNYEFAMNVTGLAYAPTAIYTHCYNSTKDRIFCGGGPTQFGLYGNYLGFLSRDN